MSDINNIPIEFIDKTKTSFASMRMAFDDLIVSMGSLDKKLVLVAADGTVSPKFASMNPDRFFDVGIAEQNQIGISAGLATKGFTVITNAITSHVIYNAYMQIRNALCFSNLPVIIVGVGAGVSYGPLGYTHHAPEDIASLYTLPNMKIYLPADANEAKLALLDAYKRKGVSYIRIGARLDPIIYSLAQLKKVYFDKPVVLQRGNQVLLLATGIGVDFALTAADKLKRSKISVEVINLNSLGIESLEELLPYLKKYKLIITIEEHYRDTGIGSIVKQELYGNTTVPILCLGLSKKFRETAGSREEILQDNGVSPEHIINTVISNLDI